MAESLKSGPSISLIDNKSGSNAMGVGNFKGIMLCNRPFAGTQGGSVAVCHLDAT
jgi:hypothetical protein